MAIRVIYLFLFCFVFFGVGEALSGKKPDVSDSKKENFALIEKETHEINSSVSLGDCDDKLEYLGNFILTDRKHKNKKGIFKSAVVLEKEDDSSSIYQDDILRQMGGRKSSLAECRNRLLEEKISTETFLENCSGYQRKVADGLRQTYTELGKISPNKVDINYLHETRQFLSKKKDQMIDSADKIDPTLKNKCTEQKNLCDALGFVSGWCDKRIKIIDADNNTIIPNGSFGFKETVEKVIQYDLLRSEKEPIVKNIPLSSINYEFQLPFNVDGCMRPEMPEWVAESVDKFNADNDAFYRDNCQKIKVIIKMFKEKYEAKLDRLKAVQKQSESAIYFYSDYPESKVKKIKSVIANMKKIPSTNMPGKKDKSVIISQLKKIKSSADVLSSKEEIVEQYALSDARSCFDTYARLYSERIEDYERQIQEMDDGKSMSLGEVLFYLVQHRVLVSKT